MLNISHNIYNDACSIPVTVLPVAMNHDVMIMNMTCGHAVFVRPGHYSTSQCQEIMASKDHACHHRDQRGMPVTAHWPDPQGEALSP